MGRKLVCGIGIYEKGEFRAYIGKTPTMEYLTWSNMLRRCYSSSYQSGQPTYVGCTVCNEWLEFQTFARWLSSNRPTNKGEGELDKDLKIRGNRVYSPQTCMFVSKTVNNFINEYSNARGPYLIGVYWEKDRNMFKSQCNNPFTRRKENVGRFNTELEAHLAWRKRKSELAYELAMIQTNVEVGSALLRWKDMLDMNLIHTYQQKRPIIGA